MSDLIEQDPFNRRVRLLLPVVHQRSGRSRMSLNGEERSVGDTAQISRNRSFE